MKIQEYFVWHELSFVKQKVYEGEKGGEHKHSTLLGLEA
jgi:hypothetical protein